MTQVIKNFSTPAIVEQGKTLSRSAIRAGNGSVIITHAQDIPNADFEKILRNATEPFGDTITAEKGRQQIAGKPEIAYTQYLVAAKNSTLPIAGITRFDSDNAELKNRIDFGFKMNGNHTEDLAHALLSRMQRYKRGEITVHPLISNRDEAQSYRYHIGESNQYLVGRSNKMKAEVQSAEHLAIARDAEDEITPLLRSKSDDFPYDDDYTTTSSERTSEPTVEELGLEAYCKSIETKMAALRKNRIALATTASKLIRGND